MFALDIFFILLIAIIVYPFWRIDEAFNTMSVKFEGKRWSLEQWIKFEKAITNTKPKLESLQDDMFIVFDDYKRVMSSMENVAYKQKKALNDIPKEYRNDVIKRTGLSKTPVKDFYDPLMNAKDEGYNPIITRSEHDLSRSLPRVAIAPLGPFESDDSLAWVNHEDNDSKYDKEEEIYKSIPIYLPSFLASVNEVLKNAKILRQNSGEQSWALRPRIEKLKARADMAEKEAKSEGFTSKSKIECIRTIKTVDYDYWGDIADEISTKLNQIDDLIRKSKQDIMEAERISQELEAKGQKGKRKAQNAV